MGKKKPDFLVYCSMTQIVVLLAHTTCSSMDSISRFRTATIASFKSFQPSCDPSHFFFATGLWLTVLWIFFSNCNHTIFLSNFYCLCLHCGIMNGSQKFVRLPVWLYLNIFFSFLLPYYDEHDLKKCMLGLFLISPL